MVLDERLVLLGLEADTAETEAVAANLLLREMIATTERRLPAHEGYRRYIRRSDSDLVQLR